MQIQTKYPANPVGSHEVKIESRPAMGAPSKANQPQQTLYENQTYQRIEKMKGGKVIKNERLNE